MTASARRVVTPARGRPGVAPPRRRRVARLLGPVAALAAAGVVAAVLHVVDPNQPGHYPTDPLLALTGWWCPGCGSLRALHALTDGDLGTALARNPLALAMFGVLGGMWVRWAARAWTGRPRTLLAPPWVLWAFLALVLVFWVARNLPGATWLSPA